MNIDLLKLINDAKRLRPRTKMAYANVIRQWLAFAGADPTAWTGERAQAFYDHLVAPTADGGAGFGIATANTMIVGGLMFAFTRAGQLYGIPNPVTAVDRYHAPREQTRHALPVKDAVALLHACDGNSLADLRDRALLQLGLYTGMRRMSLVSVDLEHVVDHGAFVTLRILLKGGGEYDAPLDKRAWVLTEPYRKALIKARGGKAGPMFTRLRPTVSTASPTIGLTVEGRLTEDGLFKALEKRAETARVKDFSPHILRHTFVTWCRGLPGRVDVQFVAAVTGHTERHGASFPSLEVYTNRATLAGDAARLCYEAITAKLEIPK